MANEGFNGSTITVTGIVTAPLLSISHDDSAAEIDVTGAGDALHTYVAGLANPSITFEVVGVTDATIGDEGPMVITWFTSTGPTNGIIDLSAVVVTAVSVNGSVDGPITSSITVRPSSAIAASSGSYQHV